MTTFLVGALIALCLVPPAPESPLSEAAAAVIEAARHLIFRERWRMELPVDRPLPSDMAATLERALAALDAAEAQTEGTGLMGCHLDRHDVYPSVHEINPITVAGVMDTVGKSACRERWHWLNDHYLADLAVRGRRLIAAGQKWTGPTAPKRRGPEPGQGRRKAAVAG